MEEATQPHTTRHPVRGTHAVPLMLARRGYLVGQQQQLSRSLCRVPALPALSVSPFRCSLRRGPANFQHSLALSLSGARRSLCRALALSVSGPRHSLTLCVRNKTLARHRGHRERQGPTQTDGARAGPRHTRERHRQAGRTHPVPAGRQLRSRPPQSRSSIRVPPVQPCRRATNAVSGPPAQIRVPPIQPGAFPFFQERTPNLIVWGMNMFLTVQNKNCRMIILF